MAVTELIIQFSINVLTRCLLFRHAVSKYFSKNEPDVCIAFMCIHHSGKVIRYARQAVAAAMKIVGCAFVGISPVRYEFFYRIFSERFRTCPAAFKSGVGDELLSM